MQLPPAGNGQVQKKGGIGWEGKKKGREDGGRSEAAVLSHICK